MMLYNFLIFQTVRDYSPDQTWWDLAQFNPAYRFCLPFSREHLNVMPLTGISGKF